MCSYKHTHNSAVHTAPWKTTRGMSLNPHRISIFDDSYITREMNFKNYIITDHLGSTKAIVSDVKESTLNATTGVPEDFEAQIKVISNFYVYGMNQPNRSFFDADGSGRYSYMGYEKDDEVKGEGNHIGFMDYGYDPRTGERWNRDPLWKSFPYQSPYNYAGNNPVFYIDKDGEKKTTYYRIIKNGKGMVIKSVNEDYVIEKTEFYLPDNGGHIISIDWDYNVEEYVTIDLDRNVVYSTGEITTDKAWDDWMIEPSKEGDKNYGSSLVADIDLPFNSNKFEANAKSRGPDIDISDLLGGRGGGKITGTILQFVDVLNQGISFGGQLGDIVDNTIDYVSSSSIFCKICNDRYLQDPKTGELTYEKTTKEPTDTVEYHGETKDE